MAIRLESAADRLAVGDHVQQHRTHDLFGHMVAASVMTEQLPLPLAWADGASDDAHGDIPSFLLGGSNRAAVDHLARHADWPMPASLLCGPRGSGKSLLARLFVAHGHGDAIDPLDSLSEEALFHRWNRALEVRQPLLLVVPEDWEATRVALPDLRTRLATAPLVRIEEPDADLSAALVERLLTLRGLNPAPDVGQFIAARIERSYSAIHAAVEIIDRCALASGRAVTRPMASLALQILDNDAVDDQGGI